MWRLNATLGSCLRRARVPAELGSATESESVFPSKYSPGKLWLKDPLRLIDHSVMFSRDFQ